MKQLFKTAFDACPETLTGVVTQGTGYYENLVHRNLGTIPSKFIDDKGRHGLVLPLSEDIENPENLIVFERYSNNETIIVSNGAPKDSRMILEGEIKNVALGLISTMVDAEKRVTKDQLNSYMQVTYGASAYIDKLHRRVENYFEDYFLVE